MDPSQVYMTLSARTVETINDKYIVVKFDYKDNHTFGQNLFGLIELQGPERTPVCIRAGFPWVIQGEVDRIREMTDDSGDDDDSDSDDSSEDESDEEEAPILRFFRENCLPEQAEIPEQGQKSGVPHQAVVRTRRRAA